MGVTLLDTVASQPADAYLASARAILAAIRRLRAPPSCT